MAIRPSKYVAGSEVDSTCTKCKLLLAHTIIAMKGDAVAKVKCNTCGSEQRFRPPPSASEATAAKRRAERLAAAERAEKKRATPSEFELLTKGKDLTRAKPYSPASALAVDDAVDHPTFGLGIVVEVREGNKAQVAFRDGGRVLIHSRA
jgi:DNA-directed RNA polymerase subunit M/transcription elongation factor TFIIS